MAGPAGNGRSIRCSSSANSSWPGTRAHKLQTIEEQTSSFAPRAHAPAPAKKPCESAQGINGLTGAH
eukprot:8861081-Karenia_brevis.AAC.1